MGLEVGPEEQVALCMPHSLVPEDFGGPTGVCSAVGFACFVPQAPGLRIPKGLSKTHG